MEDAEEHAAELGMEEEHPEAGSYASCGDMLLLRRRHGFV